MKAKSLGLVAAAAMLSACAMSTPPEVRREVDQLAATAEPEALARPVDVPVPRSDLAIFEAGSLERSVAEAVARHPAVQRALLGQADALYRSSEASAAFLPGANLTGRAGVTDNEGTTEMTSALGLGVETSWTIFDGGARRYRLDRERFRILSALHSTAERLEVVAVDIAEAHLDALRRRELLTVAQNTVARHKEIAAFVAQRVETGAGNRVDLAAARARVSAAEYRLAEAQRQLADAEARYVRLVGRPAGVLSVPTMPAAGLLVDGMMSAAKDHPSVKVCKSDLQAAIQNLLAADAERGGALALSVGPVGWQHLGRINADPFTIGAALLRASVPLLDGGAGEARLRRAVTNTKIAMTCISDYEDQITFAVRQAFHGLSAARDQLAHATAQERADDDVRAGYWDQYQAARRPLIDVLAAEDEAFSAIGNAISARYAVLFSHYRLLAASGQLARTLGAVEWRTEMVDGKHDPFADLVKL